MEGLLTPVSTSYKIKDHENTDFLTEIPQIHKAAVPRITSKASSPEEALDILRNEPDYETLISTLEYLVDDSSEFSVLSPSPVAAQLVYVLVSETVPTYWAVFQSSLSAKKAEKTRRRKASTDLKLLMFCLRSVTGFNAILLSLKQHIQLSKATKKSVGGPSTLDALISLLQLLTALLEGNKTVETISNSIWLTQENHLKQKAIWNELLGIVAGGKFLGISAEAEDVINGMSKDVGEKVWVSDGTLYSKWLATNISHWARALDLEMGDRWQACVDLLSKSFRLGHTELFVKEIIISLLLQQPDHAVRFEKILSGLPPFDQKNFILSSLQLMSKEYLSSIVTSQDDSNWWHADETVVAATAKLLSQIINKEEARKAHILTWLTGASGAGVGDGIAIRRAVVAALASEKADIETVLDKSLQQFGDQLYIRHTPTMQQEVHAQVLLLVAGYVNRKSPLRLGSMMRSGAHLSLVSNRLSASSPRARFLGMIVGEALSSLTDREDKRMDFKMEELNTSEARWYKSLVGVSDNIGSLKPLLSRAVLKTDKKPQPIKSRQPKISTPPHTGSKIVAIEEIEDSEEEEESDNDGLTPYAKPDSDEEDSDEDATLITRNKPTAPVYIRDLITYLRDSENYDKQKLGLQTAAPLIRRKSTFGTEVSAHAEELAALLIGIQDKYEMDDFQEMRLQGMIAIIIAQPLKMGQWFSKTFFDGDYSISQRASILTTLGLGARELGGFGSEDTKKTISSFPSKALPEKMHKVYGFPSAVDNLSTQLSNTMIAPMAASLADKLTGPSILKVRTFSSRMAVEKARKKPIANSLAKVVADGFFFPLTGRFFIHLRASRTAVIFQPYLLALFIKTLSLLIHASGPSNLSLPQMTSEFWDLLLSLRTQSIGDIIVVEALLFAFLTILEINEDKRQLVDAHGRQILETQEWVESVFGRLAAGGSEEDERVRMLAAGCLVRIREVVEKYQALLLGDLASFQN